MSYETQAARPWRQGYKPRALRLCDRATPPGMGRRQRDLLSGAVRF